MSFVAVETAVWPILGSILAGGVIGLEREWRGRAAGLRTHVLVSLASALLMLAAMSQADWAFRALPDENIVTDPTRMAHGVLTGIGFLCAGVIFRTGFSIHGLTTAASLWVTSALGLLFGAGLYELGILGTATTALILGGLRMVNRRLPSRVVTDVEIRWDRHATSPEREIEALLEAADQSVQAGRLELEDSGRIVRTWRIATGGPDALNTLATALAAQPSVISYRLDPRDE